MRLKDRSAQKFRRQTIVRLNEEGHGQSKIAELLDVSQSYVSRIIRSYKKVGTQAFEVSTGKGAVSRLSGDQKVELCELLEAGAVSYGFEGAIWTSKRVQRVIAEQFGVLYSQRQVDRILKELNYTRQKPQKVDYRQSKASVEAWKTEGLAALKKSSGRKKRNGI